MLWLRNARTETGIEAATGPGTADGQTAIGIGLDGDIIRGDALATLLDVDAVCVETARQRDALLATAQRDADAIIEVAQVTAAELIDDAQQRFDAAYAEGEAAGLQHAMEDWHARSAALFVAERELFMKMRERFAALVVGALEQLVPTLDRASLFAQAAQQMDRLVDAGSALSVRVHPDDVAFARDAFDACAQRWLALGRPVTVSTIADPALAPGACLCESDLGTLDASLDLQIAALRGALEQTLHELPLADEVEHGGLSAADYAAGADHPDDGYESDDGYASDDDWNDSDEDAAAEPMLTGNTH